MSPKTLERTPGSWKSALARAGLDWILCIGLAFGAALLIKWQVVDAYAIPTGSMEPLLYGKEHGGDRIFCNKLTYRLGNRKGPLRWEVFVFRFPTSNPNAQYYGENFIKRCVGLPGETIFLVDGDVFVADDASPLPEMARKPLPLQDEIWIPVYREDFNRGSADALAYHWDRMEAEGAWTLAGGTLHGRAREKESIHLRYRPMVAGIRYPGVPDRHIKRQVVLFTCPYCHSLLRKTVQTQQLTAYCPSCGAFLTEDNIDPGNFSFPGLRNGNSLNFHIIKDLRFSCRLTPRSEEGAFLIDLNTDSDSWRARISFGAEGEVVLEQNGRPVEGRLSKATLPMGESQDVEFFRADGRLVLRIQGKEVLIHEIPGSMPAPYKEAGASGIILTLENGAAEIDNVSIDRDIHYFSLIDPSEGYRVPEDGYFALGDNVPTSHDSRSWGKVPSRNLIGPALFIWWPPNRLHILE
ncbi:MAG: signal peptidase I [Planctomycetota bacterium]